MHRGRAAATCARRLAAIAICHRAAGFSPSSPTEHEVVRSVHRGAPKTRVGVAQHPKTALVDDDLRQTGRPSTSPPASVSAIARYSCSASRAPSGADFATLEVPGLRFEPEGSWHGCDAQVGSRRRRRFRRNPAGHGRGNLTAGGSETSTFAWRRSVSTYSAVAPTPIAKSNAWVYDVNPTERAA